jgi:GntR family transcriptional regulator
VEGRVRARGNGVERAEAVLRVSAEDPAPAYVQLERQVRVAVADGLLRPGDRLPSIRVIARRLNLSPNTVARAYATLAREGVIIARAGGGSEVAPIDSLDRPALARLRQERLNTLARQVAVRGLALGLEPGEIVQAVTRELAAHGRPVPLTTPMPKLGAAEAPLLSARNRLRGTVASVRVGDVLAEVVVDLPAGVQMVAAITRASLERLGLAVGGPVSVYAKASELTLGN